MRATKIRVRGHYELVSRENALLANNILLVAALIVVLLGTLLPLVHKQLGLGSVSIGEPFFNLLFTWLAVPFAFFIGIGPLIRWKRDNLSKLKKELIFSGVASVVLGFASVAIFADRLMPLAVLGAVMGIWITLLIGLEVYRRATYRHTFWQGIGKLGRSHWAMVLGHLGLAVTILGISMVQNYDIERDVKMSPSDVVNIQGYDFKFNALRIADGPNYEGYLGEFDVFADGQHVNRLSAEKRFYTVQQSMMTEAAIDRGITRDLYVALGERLPDGAWAVRIYHKPFVRWIWFGAVLMALGGMLAISDKRYRFRQSRSATVSQGTAS